MPNRTAARNGKNACRPDWAWTFWVTHTQHTHTHTNIHAVESLLTAIVSNSVRLSVNDSCFQTIFLPVHGKCSRVRTFHKGVTFTLSKR